MCPSNPAGMLDLLLRLATKLKEITTFCFARLTVIDESKSGIGYENETKEE
jgi:hypothetical protein